VNRIVLAGAAGIVAVGAVSASAASLGGVTSDSVGVDSGVVASCDTDGISVDYTVAYAAASQRYNVASVVLTGVAAACNGKAFSVTLADDTTPLGESTGTVSLGGGSTETIDVGSLSVDGELVDSIAVAIVG
jgi:hypothetical protein